MKILTFDTSTETMFVTISNDSNVEAYKIIETTEKSYNSAHLIPTIIELLKSQNLTMQDIEAIGVNTGPGSFTGIRASATVAKVMAQQLDIPVVGISSMEIYSLLNNSDKDTLVLLDARRGKAYMAVYGKDGKFLQEPSAIEYEKAIEWAKNNELFVISDKKMSEILKEAEIESLNLSEAKEKHEHLLAGSDSQDKQENFGVFLAKLTYKYLNNNVIARRAEGSTRQSQSSEFKWHNLKPLYIQPPPISMPKAK